MEEKFYNIRQLGSLQYSELFSKAKDLEVDTSIFKSSNKITEIFFHIIKKISQSHQITGNGILEILDDGFGFLRSTEASYSMRHDDIYINHQQIKKYNLRVGDEIECTLNKPFSHEKHFAMHKITKINGISDIKSFIVRDNFDKMTPIFPYQRLKIEENLASNDISNRLISVISPIGKGQRCLVVAPPRSGKTYILQNIARGIEKNHPEVKLIVLLIDERPEEVTDMVSMIQNGEVISSTFDEPTSKHLHVAEMTIERAKRLVECDQDVVILLDSITRLTRACNTALPSSGKLLTGGLDANAIQKPKKFFGSARNIKNKKSLTIISTALIDTGSRMDEVIFEEFKSTGNSEIVLDRSIAEKRVFPAIDVLKSGTRKDGLLVGDEILNRMWILHRILSSMDSMSSTEFLINKLKVTKDNMQFFDLMGSVSKEALN